MSYGIYKRRREELELAESKQAVFEALKPVEEKEEQAQEAPVSKAKPRKTKE